MIDDSLKFETFEEFCMRANEILKRFKEVAKQPNFKLQIYKSYIYEKHTFNKDTTTDMRVKDKCWMWLMSYKYEKMDMNDLYCTLGMLKKREEEQHGNSL